MPSRRTNNFAESGRGLGHVTPTILGSTVGYPSDSLASCTYNFSYVTTRGKSLYSRILEDQFSSPHPWTSSPCPCPCPWVSSSWHQYWLSVSICCFSLLIDCDVGCGMVKARSAAPCILFFDELDSIAKARSSHPVGLYSGGKHALRIAFICCTRQS